MSEIPPVNGASGLLSVPPLRPSERNGESEHPQELDQVEISQLAQLLSDLGADGDIRVEKVLTIREAIANGTYETQEKLDYTVGRLLDVLTAPEP